jgi:hypothetical protein
MTDADRKRFATLQALAAIQMIELVSLEGDNGRPQFWASKWAITRHFDNLSEVADWLQMITGQVVAK